MKRKMVLLFVVATLLLFAACSFGGGGLQVESAQTSSSPVLDYDDVTGAASQVESGKPATIQPPENFDALLAGNWTMVSAQENGQIRVATFDDGRMIMMRGGLGFTFDGSVYGGFFDDSRNSNELQPLFEQVSAKDGVLTIPFDSEGLDITIQYALQDVKESSQVDNSYDNYFAKYDGDQLTLTMTGTYKSSPTSQETIDSTFVFEKDYPLFNDGTTFGAAMIGSWQDNMGNTWTFSVGNKDNGKALPDTSFYLMDASGKRYDGKEISMFGAAQDDTDCTETVSFYFTDGQSSADVVRAKIVSFDGYTLTLEEDNGTQLILTRIS